MPPERQGCAVITVPVRARSASTGEWPPGGRRAPRRDLGRHSGPKIAARSDSGAPWRICTPLLPSFHTSAGRRPQAVGRHQRGVRIELGVERGGDLGQRLQAVVAQGLRPPAGQRLRIRCDVRTFIRFQRGSRVLVAEQRGRLAGAGRRQDADHDVPQLHLAGIDPRPGIGPQLVAVRAVRVGEDVDRSRRVGASVGDPVALFEAAPDGVGHRLGEQPFPARRRCGSLPLASNSVPAITCLPSGVTYRATGWVPACAA